MVLHSDTMQDVTNLEWRNDSPLNKGGETTSQFASRGNQPLIQDSPPIIRRYYLSFNTCNLSADLLLFQMHMYASPEKKYFYKQKENQISLCFNCSFAFPSQMQHYELDGVLFKSCSNEMSLVLFASITLNCFDIELLYCLFAFN